MFSEACCCLCKRQVIIKAYELTFVGTVVKVVRLVTCD